MTRTLLTVGYGAWKDPRRRMEGMIAALKAARATALVDIRHSPCASDPHPDHRYSASPWNLQASGGIADALQSAGIEYRWMVELGNPQRHDPQMTILRSQLRSIDQPWPVHRGLRLLAEMVADESRRCAILCACGDYQACHRRLIAEALSHGYFGNELKILDLTPTGPAEQASAQAGSIGESAVIMNRTAKAPLGPS